MKGCQVHNFAPVKFWKLTLHRSNFAAGCCNLLDPKLHDFLQVGAVE